MEPNFFIVGAPKSATTNISYYLKQHPEILISKLNEPYYFCKYDVARDFKRESMIWNEKDYLKLFDTKNKVTMLGEATPAYFHSPSAAKKIKERFPESKIIICLRNPIERSFSSYLSLKLSMNEKKEFSEIIESHLELIKNNKFDIYNCIEPGFYSIHLERYLKYFKKESIKIIIFEEYINNIFYEINKLFEFLNVKKLERIKNEKKFSYRIPKNNIASICYNNKKIRKLFIKFVPTTFRQKVGDSLLLKEGNKPKIIQKDRQKLINVYFKDVKNLERILNRKLPWSDFDD